MFTNAPTLADSAVGTSEGTEETAGNSSDSDSSDDERSEEEVCDG